MVTHAEWIVGFVRAARKQASEKGLPYVGAHSQYTGMEDQFRAAFPGIALYTIDNAGKAAGPLMEAVEAGKVVIRESIARRAGTTASAGEFVGFTVYEPDNLPTQNRVVVSSADLERELASISAPSGGQS